MILLGALLLANCSGDFEQETGIVPSHSGQVSFLFGLQQDDASVVQTRGSKLEQITRMWYAIANERGEIIKPLYQKLEENFSKLTIEGLSMGDYTVVFLATTSEEEDEAVKEPEKLSDDWLINHAENAPLDAVYFYKKIELHIGRDQASVSHTVVLERSVGRVDVDLNVSSDYMWRFIRKIDITFDDAEGIYATLGADGKYSGTRKIESYDITGKYSFYSLSPIAVMELSLSVNTVSRIVRLRQAVYLILVLIICIRKIRMVHFMFARRTSFGFARIRCFWPVSHVRSFMTVAVVLFMRMLRCRFPFQTNISCLSSSFLL